MNNEDLVIIFHLKEYLNSLIEQGTDKIFYDILFNDEKVIDCINALNNLIEECSNKNQIIFDLQRENTKISETNRKLTAITNKYEAYEMPFTDEDRIIIASKKYFANGLFKTKFTNKELLDEKDNIIQNIIKRLDNDINNITDLIRDRKSFSTDNFLTGYSRVRLKAYRTKTKEIKELIEKEYFKKEGESDEKL